MSSIENIKKSIKSSRDFLESINDSKLQDLRLEEIIDEDSIHLITLSYTVMLVDCRRDRVYKQFKVDAKTHKTLSMKIRIPE